MHRRPEIYCNMLFGLLFLAGWGLAGCAGDSARACADQSDCFVGELCVTGRCESEQQLNNGGGDTTGAGNNGHLEDGGSHSGNNDNACIADPFEGSCEPDEFEPNEQWIDSFLIAKDESWCADEDTFVEARQYSARLCGSDHDAYQIRVRKSANTCISGRTRIRVTIEVESIQCAPELFDIYPYWNTGQSACENDEYVQCTRSDDGRQLEIVWAEPESFEFYRDVNFVVETFEPNFKLDYDFSVEVESY